ncbi:MAG: hypothetical protein QNK23_06080 [Crocinitomicaceae bacterium]|nr:hypothetical protein [Crocinitomicaceae bacterium]
MKKFNLIMTATILAMVFASCGGEDNSEPAETLDDIVSEYEDSQDDEEDDDDDDDEDLKETDDSVSNEEWDEILDGYEDYVDDYVAIIQKQKADPSDMSIMTEYQELMLKGTEWSSQMAEASSEFGLEQLTRMQEIQAKLASAAF